MSDFKSKTIVSIFWNLTERLGNQVLRFGLGIVLARLLLPSDYGILALTTIVIAFSEILIDGGLMMVLIQRSSNSNKEYSTVFWSRLFSAIVLFVLIFFTSTYIAQFYETPILKQVLQVISFVLVLNSLSSVHKVKLTNNLDFKGQAKIVLVSTLLGGITGISLALLDYGVWALVFQTLTIHIIQAVLFWFYTKWIPSATYSVSFMKSVFAMGIYFLSNNVLLIIYNNLYVTIMGKIYNPTTLGLFTRGRQFEQLPENTTNSLIVKVLFPILSKDKENKLKLKNHTVEILSWLSYIITPIMLLLVINAEPIIEFFLTEKWLGASDFLIILAIAGIFIPINNTLLNIFNVIGKPIVSSQVYLFKIVFTATLIFFVWEHGALWTVSIIILDNILVLSILGVITKRFIGLSMKSIFKSIGSVFLINALAFTLVYCFLTYSTFILGNFTHIMVSAIMYCFMIYVLSSILKMNQIKQIDKRIKNLFLKK